ncbi:MAG TPA: RNA polymerase sigma factor [Paraburkholderia sp.]|jgi:RNA polymerase sigma-70 factor (ECF subfamily)
MGRSRIDSALRGLLPQLWKFALRVTASTETAEELVKETYAAMLAGRREPAPDVSLRADTFAVMLALWKRTKHTIRDGRAVGSRSSAANARETNSEMHYRLLEVIYGLPDDERVTLILIEAECLRYSEAAWALGISIATLKAQLVRARIAIARELAADARP